MGGAVTMRLNFLRRPQSFRSVPFPSLCSVHASSSPQGDGGMEIRHRRRLKSDRRDQAVSSRSLRDIADQHSRPALRCARWYCAAARLSGSAARAEHHTATHTLRSSDITV
jgi:hypothetical protein